MDTNNIDAQNKSLVEKRDALLAEIVGLQNSKVDEENKLSIAIQNKTAALVDESEIQGRITVLKQYWSDLETVLPIHISNLQDQKDSLATQISSLVDKKQLLEETVSELNRLSDSIGIINDTINADQQKVRQFLNVLETAVTQFDQKSGAHIQTISDFAMKLVELYQVERTALSAREERVRDLERSLKAREAAMIAEAQQGN